MEGAGRNNWLLIYLIYWILACWKMDRVSVIVLTKTSIQFGDFSASHVWLPEGRSTTILVTPTGLDCRPYLSSGHEGIKSLCYQCSYQLPLPYRVVHVTLDLSSVETSIPLGCRFWQDLFMCLFMICRYVFRLLISVYPIFRHTHIPYSGQIRIIH